MVNKYMQLVDNQLVTVFRVLWYDYWTIYCIKGEKNERQNTTY